MRVLLVSPYSAKRTGGIGTWSRIVLDFCDSAKDVDLLFLNTATSLPKRKAMSNKIAHLLVGGIDTAKILLVLFWKMLVLHPEIVHYTSSAGSALYKDLMAIWIVKSLFKKKFVIHWHFGRIPTIFQERGKEYNLFVKVCSKADISITIDKASHNVLTKNKIKSFNIPNAIPQALQAKTESLNVENLATRRANGEVLFVGHMLKTKGLSELVKACTECEDVKQLTCVGPFFDDNYKRELKDIAIKRNGGSWLCLVGEKNREEVWEYYKKCNIFCLPSYSEGFPYVILEAMSFGCPIVATNVGAIPEMLGDECGLCVGTKNIESLRNAIRHILSNEKEMKDMGMNAHKKVLDNYTVERVFDMYKKVWNSI